MKTDKYIYLVIGTIKYSNVIEVDLTGLTSYNGLNNTFSGTVSIEDNTGWKHFTGEHGSNDYLNEFGIKLILNPNHFEL